MPGGRGNSKNKLKRIKDIIKEGKAVSDVWAIPAISSSAKERVGYPTQKPLALLDRIIKASSNHGDVVLDPFCGCATALVAANRLERQWVGIDLSPKAGDLVVERIRWDEKLFGDIQVRTRQPQAHRPWTALEGTAKEGVQESVVWPSDRPLQWMPPSIPAPGGFPHGPYRGQEPRRDGSQVEFSVAMRTLQQPEGEENPGGICGYDEPGEERLLLDVRKECGDS